MAMAPSNTNVDADPSAFRGVLPASILAGLLGSILMMGLAMAYVKTLGIPFERPLRWMAASIYGEQALYRDDANVLWSGAILHLLTSLFWAMFFSLFVSRRDSAAKSLSLGFLFSVGIWVIMTYFILPFIDPVMSTEIAEVPFVWFGLHLVFGAALALTPTLSRRLMGDSRTPLNLSTPLPSRH